MSEPFNAAASTVQQCQAHLDGLLADKNFSARLASRDPETFAQFDVLSRRIAGAEAAAPTPVSKSAEVTLDRFTSDPGLGKKLLAGDPDTNRRFHELSAAVANSDGRDLLTEMIVGGAASELPFNDVTTAGELPLRDKLNAITQLRESGLNDMQILESFHGAIASPTEVAKAKALRTQLMDDKEWCAKLLAGNFEQRRQLRLLSIILAGT
jgi:hypothetical protein